MERIEFLRDSFRKIIEIKLTRYKDLGKQLDNLADTVRCMKPNTDISKIEHLLIDILTKMATASAEDVKLELTE